MDIQIFESTPSPKATNLILFIAVIITIICSIIMRPIETFLVEKSGFGVLDLEFMWRPEQARIILEAWEDEGIEKEILVTYYDMLFLVGYSTLIAAIGLRNIRTYVKLHVTPRALAKRLYSICLTPFIAAVFDFIENINLLIVLSNPDSIQAVNTFMASFFAAIKFILLIIVILVILGIFCMNIVQKLKQKK